MSKNGRPQTINLTCATVGGRVIRAPIEIWIAALVDSLDSRAKQAIFEKVEKMAASARRIYTVAPPKTVSDLMMPKTQ